MPNPQVFARPALPALINRVTQQLAVNLPGLTPQLRRATTVVVGTVLAQELAQLYAYLDNFASWFFVSTSEGIYLDRRGSEVGVGRIQGSPAVLNVTFTGLPAYGVPKGAVLQSQDQTLTFTLNSAVTIAAGQTTASGAVTCTANGTSANLAAGTVLTLTTAEAGIQAQAVVAGVETSGTSVEADDAYRIRILLRMRNPAQGGAGNDYIAWAKLYAGITRCWVFPAGTAGVAAGSVVICPVFDGRAPASIAPSGADISAISAVIAPVRPVTASFTVAALALDAIAVTIQGLTVQPGFSPAQVQANVNASLAQLFAGTTAGGATFGDGVPWGTTGGALMLDDIYSAISNSEGVGEFNLVAPTADITSANFHLAVFGGAATYE